MIDQSIAEQSTSGHKMTVQDGTEPTTVRISYFSDVLCVWAYVGQRRLEELQRAHGTHIEMVYRYIQVFGHIPNKLDASWSHRGGAAAYGAHVHSVVAGFDGMEIHPDIWQGNVPASSAPAHVFLKAVGLLQRAGMCSAAAQTQFDGRTFEEEAAWQVRLAFFRDLRNVGRRDVLLEVAEDVGLSRVALERHLDDGTALAELCFDQERKSHHGVTGSPTWVLNQGRQKLFGNVGYRIVEANLLELLGDTGERLSWC